MVLAYYQTNFYFANGHKVPERETERDGVQIQSKGNVSVYVILNTYIFIPSANVSMKPNDEMHQKSTFLFK